MNISTRVAKTSVAAALAASAALGLAACGSGDTSSAAASTTSASQTAPKAAATVRAVPGGSTGVTLDQGFVSALGQLGLTPGTVGSATLANGTISFPITGGTVTLYDKASGYRPWVQGILFHQGSGLSLAAGGTTVQITNLAVDPGKPARVFGDVSVNGQLAAPSAPIFNLDGSTLKPVTMDADGSAVLDGTRVLLSEEAAALLNSTFKTNAVQPSLLIGTATITVKTK
jgi:hypothetical protein